MTTPSAGTRGPYAKTAQVRQRILDACTEVFADSGYRATTMKEIARRAEISERGLVHHFASKVELLGAVLERREQEAGCHVTWTSGTEALLALVDVIAEDTRRPGLVELKSTLSAEAISPDHPAHEYYRRRYDAVRRFATQAFETLEREGELESPLTPAELAAGFIALSDGLQLQWLYDRSGVDAVAILHRFLESVVPRLAARR